MTLARVPDQEDSALASMGPEPTEIISYATKVANALKDVVQQKGLFADIRGKKHVKAEGWETVIALDQAHPLIESVTPVVSANGETIAYRARAHIVKDGQTVASAEMTCGMDEFPTKGQDGYAKHRAAMSAAQTWAIAKAARTKYAWIVALAGYEGTPAEEMPQENGGQKSQPTHRATQPPRTNGASTSEGQPWTEFWEFVKKSGHTPQEALSTLGTPPAKWIEEYGDGGNPFQDLRMTLREKWADEEVEELGADQQGESK